MKRMLAVVVSAVSLFAFAGLSAAQNQPYATESHPPTIPDEATGQVDTGAKPAKHMKKKKRSKKARKAKKATGTNGAAGTSGTTGTNGTTTTTSPGAGGTPGQQ